MYTHLEDYIHDLYCSISITTPKQIDMFTIAKRLNVEIIYDEKPIFYFDNEIILKHTNKTQEWLDFSHELAHFLLHSGCQLDMYPPYQEYQEWRADLFALHFCVPTFMLEKITLPKWKDDAIRLIVETFNVDHEFAQKRIDMWQQKELFLLLNKQERMISNGIL